MPWHDIRGEGYYGSAFSGTRPLTIFDGLCNVCYDAERIPFLPADQRIPLTGEEPTAGCAAAMGVSAKEHAMAQVAKRLGPDPDSDEEADAKKASSVLQMKEAGNTLFRKKDFRSAEKQYARALQAAADLLAGFISTDTELLVTLHSNRSECLLKLEAWAEAADEAEAALELDSGHDKSQRRLQRAEEMGAEMAGWQPEMRAEICQAATLQPAHPLVPENKSALLIKLLVQLGHTTSEEARRRVNRLSEEEFRVEARRALEERRQRVALVKMLVAFGSSTKAAIERVKQISAAEVQRELEGSSMARPDPWAERDPNDPFDLLVSDDESEDDDDVPAFMGRLADYWQITPELARERYKDLRSIGGMSKDEIAETFLNNGGGDDDDDNDL